MDNKETYNSLPDNDTFVETKENWEAAAAKVIKPEWFKIHSHATGKIMGVKGFGLTGEKVIKEWYLKRKYGRDKSFWSKFVEKGLAVEDASIKMLSEAIGEEMTKNEKFFEDKYIQGTPDVMTSDTIYDLKSSWDLYTFPFFDKEVPNKDYEYQLQSYMAITGKKKAVLVYCLIDTPQPLVQMELKKLYYESGGKAEDWTPEVNIELAENYKFNDIPFFDRIRTFEVSYNQDVVNKIHARVEECRNYLKTLLNN